MKHTILPGEGIDGLLFGADPKEVQALFGPPQDKDVEKDDEGVSEMWLYPDLGLTLFFEGSEILRLAAMESSDPSCTLYGKNIFELNEAGILEWMQKHNAGEPDSENEAWGERRVSFDDLMIDFYFKDGRLITVNWSIIDEED